MAPMKCPAQREDLDEIQQSYSLTHLAQRWGVSRKAVRKLLQQGELPFVEIEGQLRVTVDAVQQIELGGDV